MFSMGVRMRGTQEPLHRYKNSFKKLSVSIFSYSYTLCAKQWPMSYSNTLEKCDDIEWG